MRIAFICNMNNHFFSTVRHLRERGVDAHLVLLNDEVTHFHPSNDTFDLGYQAFTHTVDWGDHQRFTTVPPERIAKDLAPFDVLVGCGSAPAFARRAGRELAMFVPYGSDLDEMPFYRVAPPRRGAVRSLWELPYAQRMAIRDVPLLGGAKTPQFEDLFDRLGCKGRRLGSPIPPLYATDFNPETIGQYANRSNWFVEFERIRRASDLVVFHHGRLLWKSRTTALSYKGNDKLLRGFAAFAEQHPSVKPALVLFEYGPDVYATKELAAELCITSLVHWFPLMSRKEALLGMTLADIACGEFAVSYNFGGVIIEGIAMGKPLLHHRIDSMYPEADRFPIMNVFTADEMRDALADYVVRPAHYQALGRQARDWFVKNVIERGTDTLVDVLVHPPP